MKNKNVYKSSGKPIDNKLSENLQGQNKRIKNKKASLIIIDGGVGEGKTTIGVHCADDIQGSPINLEHQLAMGGKQFLEKLRICYEKKLPVILYDEAGDFNKRGALTRFNAMLNRTFETYRGFQIIVILILPLFDVLDKDIFDKKIPRMLVNCHGRTEKYGNYRVYSLYRMHYLKDKMRKLVVKSQAYRYVSPNFRGHFKDLTPERSAQLDAISTAGKIEELKASEVKMEGLMAYTDLASKLNCSVSKVQRALRELKIKADKYINRRAYYKEELVDVLIDHFDMKEEK